MKTIKSYYDKVRHNIYTKQVQDLYAIPYNQEWQDRFLKKANNRSGNNRWEVVRNNTQKRIPEIELEGKLEFGLYEVTWYFVVHAARYKDETYTHISINLDRRNKEFPSMYRLTGKESVTPLEFILSKLKEYFYDGQTVISYLQYRYGYDKKGTNMIFKDYLIQQRISSHRDYSYLREWFKNKMNIDSHVSMESTIKFAKKYGKQEELTTLYAFDTSITYGFDGDIDELEEAIWDANPPQKNVVYL